MTRFKDWMPHGVIPAVLLPFHAAGLGVHPSGALAAAGAGVQPSGALAAAGAGVQPSGALAAE